MPTASNSSSGGATKITNKPHRSASESAQDNVTDEEWRVRKWVFFCVCYLTAILNYDNGAVPASLLEIEAEIPMSFSDQAMLGALVYVGLTFSSPLAGPLLTKYSARNIVAVSILLNILSVCLFTFGGTLKWMFIARVLIGITQAFPVIYAPVWIDEFSPHAYRTQWMGLLQTAVPVGMMLGYLISGIINRYAIDLISWRMGFAVQAVALVPCFVGCVLVPKKYIDTETDIDHKPRVDAIDIREATLTEQLRRLFSCQIFIWVTLGLCALFFVVTGIQYWITEYMIKVLHGDRLTVIITFAVVCITAPTCGVFVGGALVDRMGGYRGKNVVTALTVAFCFALFAVVFALPAGFVYSMLYMLPLVWMLLFFGGCTMPTSTGILMSAVPKDLRSFSSAVAMLAYNLLGYFLAPALSGAVMDAFQDKELGLIWGYRLVLLWSVFGIFFLFMALKTAKKEFADQPGGLASLVDHDMEMAARFSGFTKDEIIYENSRRRTYSF